MLSALVVVLLPMVSGAQGKTKSELFGEYRELKNDFAEAMKGQSSDLPVVDTKLWLKLDNVRINMWVLTTDIGNFLESHRTGDKREERRVRILQIASNALADSVDALMETSEEQLDVTDAIEAKYSAKSAKALKKRLGANVFFRIYRAERQVEEQAEKELGL